jgi:hypothetical protein
MPCSEPEVLVGASKKFESDGRLTDEATGNVLSGFLEQFCIWIGRFSRRRIPSDTD